jgi:adenylate cyclase
MLQVGQEYLLGRKSTKPEVTLQTPTPDQFVHKRQAMVKVTPTGVVIENLPDTFNKMRLRDGSEHVRLELMAGDMFSIGNTMFFVEESETEVSGMTIALDKLHEVESLDAADQLKHLAELTGKIRFVDNREVVEVAVLEAVLKGVERAQVATLVQSVRHPETGEYQVKILRVLSLDGDQQTLVPTEDAIRAATVVECKPIVINRHLPSGMAIANASMDWALCALLPPFPEDHCGIYVEGTLLQKDNRLSPTFKSQIEKVQQSDLKYVQVVADIYGAMKQMLLQQSVSSQLEEFLPKPVVSAINKGGARSKLEPSVAPIIFAYCDLRECCKVFDQIDDDQEILRRWSELNDFLTIFSDSLVAQEAIIEDLEGDAVKGIWGWPELSEPAEQVDLCITAARRILEKFKHHRPPAGAVIETMKFGIGMAGGTAVVGRLGSAEMFKISVAGQVPNLAARLQELTKPTLLGEPVLVDGYIHRLANQAVDEGDTPACQRLVKVKPRGMRAVVDVSRILPELLNAVEQNKMRKYDIGLQLFERGEWKSAVDQLQAIASFRPAAYLIEIMRAQHLRPPADWDGVIKF